MTEQRTFKQLMDRAGLTPARLMAEIKRLTGKDMQPSTVSHWRSGKHQPPPIAEAFVALLAERQE